MIRILIACVIFLVAACSEAPPSNDEIISETKKCEAAGLRAATILDGWSLQLKRIECRPITEQPQ